MRCPICRKAVPRDGEFIPFCSDRCRIIDLGNWASEKYVIPVAVDPEELADSLEKNNDEQDDDRE